MYRTDEQKWNFKEMRTLCVLVKHTRCNLHTVGIQECLLNAYVLIGGGGSGGVRACAQVHLRSEVLTIGRASSRGTPITFILPPLLLRSRILAKCFCRHLRSWALQGLKLLLGWSPSSLSAIRPRWGEVSTRKGQGSIPTQPPAYFLLLGHSLA